MEEACFEAAEVAFHLRGSSLFIPPLRAIYAAFPAPRPQPLDTYEITWQPEALCHWRSTTTPRHGHLRLHSPAFAPVVTTFLVGRLLEEAHPGLLTLHGNALLSPTTARLLLLVGASGSGKSTLSHLLAPYGYQQVSEDLLLIGRESRPHTEGGTADEHPPAGSCLFPFPRAAALRHARPGEEDLPWVAPGGGNAHGRRKHILPSTAPASAAPLPLSHCTVVVLQEPMPKREPNQHGRLGGHCGHNHQQGGFSPPPASPASLPSAWLTWSDDALIAALREAGIPVATVRKENDLSCLQYSAPLDSTEWQRQFQILDAAGAMLLSAGVDAPASSLTAFPPEPLGRPLTPFEGVEACLPHLRRYRPLPPHAAARHFITLARAFQSARFFSFASGGTPEQAAYQLRTMVDEPGES